MIESLSDEQWAQTHSERERWIEIGTCTDPADRETSERVITGFYSRIRKKAPKFVWLDGPLSCCTQIETLGAQGDQLSNQLSNQLRSQLRDQLWSQLNGKLSNQFRNQLWEQLRDPLESRLEGQLKDQLRRQLKDQLWTQLNGKRKLSEQFRKQLWEQFRNQLGNRLEGQFRNQLGSRLEGQLSVQALKNLALGWWFAQPSPWVSWHQVCRDVIRIEYDEQSNNLLDLWADLAKSSGWWFPLEDTCFMAERHEVIKFDAEKRLHCEVGPAILCRDGFEVYAWHGTRVPAEWIKEKDNIDPKMALTWENIEQRRCLAEILGWDQVLKQLRPTVVDQHSDPEIGVLLRVDLPEAPGEQFLKVACGTGRDFVLPVPPDVRTAQAAQDWMWDLETGQYNPEVRT